MFNLIIIYSHWPLKIHYWHILNSDSTWSKPSTKEKTKLIIVGIKKIATPAISLNINDFNDLDISPSFPPVTALNKSIIPNTINNKGITILTINKT